MEVYKAINKVQAALSKTGIAKDRHNSQGAGYKFRGIDDVYNAVSPLLAEHGLVIIPRMLARQCEERQSKNGGALFYVTVEAEFDFVAAADGSKHTARTFGESMDSGDKATNKAMSAAYKYAAFQTFAIPTEGDNDADAHTYEVAQKPIKHKPTDGLIVNEDEKPYLQDLAMELIDTIKNKRDLVAGMSRLHSEQLEADQKAFLWSLLPSDVRSQIKTAQQVPV